ncbi:MAG: diaminopimelate decarboxylase [bacterium]|nr:diaminopimelate decarboxylase [bacterium]
MDRYATKHGEVYCEDLPLRALAQQYGTPLYVYSAGTLADHFQRLDRALAPVAHTICYAVKANSNLAVLRTFAELGAGFDIVSAGELHRVLKAGGDPARIVFAGVGKTAEEIAFALRHNILFFTIESEEELLRINAIAAAHDTVARFCIRVNPDVDAHTHHYITTGKSENKFGLPFTAARALYLAAKNLRHARAVGVQMHIGSQITTTAPFVAAITLLAAFVNELRAAGVALEYVDVGGGMGIIYHDETPPTADEFAAAVVPVLRTLPAHVLFEPGRFMVGNAGVLVTQVQYLKTTASKRFVIVDAGMNDLIRPALYEAYHAILPAVPRAGAAQVVDVVGPICESGDFLGLARALPPLEPGDYLVVRSAGAYGFAMASNYNTRPRAAEVMVQGDQARVVRRRETIDDLLAAELGL